MISVKRNFHFNCMKNEATKAPRGLAGNFNVCTFKFFNNVWWFWNEAHAQGVFGGFQFSSHLKWYMKLLDFCRTNFTTENMLIFFEQIICNWLSNLDIDLIFLLQMYFNYRHAVFRCMAKIPVKARSKQAVESHQHNICVFTDRE